MVLDKSRIKMHKMVKILGDMVLLVKTDAVFVAAEDAEMARQLLFRNPEFRYLGLGKNPKFSDIGGIKVSSPKPLKKCDSSLENFIIYSDPQFIKNLIAVYPRCKRISLSNEEEMATINGDWKAIDEFMPKVKSKNENCYQALQDLLDGKGDFMDFENMSPINDYTDVEKKPEDRQNVAIEVSHVQ